MNSQRFNRDADALRKQINDLTKSTSGGRQLSEAAHRLNQVNNDMRLLMTMTMTMTKYFIQPFYYIFYLIQLLMFLHIEIRY